MLSNLAFRGWIPGRHKPSARLFPPGSEPSLPRGDSSQHSNLRFPGIPQLTQIRLRSYRAKVIEAVIVCIIRGTSMTSDRDRRPDGAEAESHATRTAGPHERLPPDRRLPEAIGRYRILRLVGEGGMGSVYEAEQDHPRRIVALKIIRPGLTSAEMLPLRARVAGARPAAASRHRADLRSRHGGHGRRYSSRSLSAGAPADGARLRPPPVIPRR